MENFSIKRDVIEAQKESSIRRKIPKRTPVKSDFEHKFEQKCRELYGKAPTSCRIEERI
jgi:hypothetical protein